MVYYLQTDGQIKWINCIIEEYLRHYINQNQNNWVQLLPQAELILTKQQNKTTKHSPFLSIYGYEFYSINKQPITENTKTLIQQTIIKNTTKIQPTNELQLKKKNKVYFHNKNFKTTKKNKKLNPVKDDPFVIEKILRKNNIKL